MEDQTRKRANRRHSAAVAVLIAAVMALAGVGGFVLASLGHGTSRGVQVTAPHSQPQAHDSAVATSDGSGGPEQSGAGAGQPAGAGQAGNPGGPGNPGNPGGPGPKGKAPNSPSAVCCVNIPIPPQGLPHPPFPNPKPTPKSPNSIKQSDGAIHAPLPPSDV